MISRLAARVIFGSLFLLSIGALRIAITSFPILKTPSFVITVDCDSFRTESMETRLESWHDDYPFFLTTRKIRDDIRAFYPVERIIVNRHLFSTVRIDITSTKPVLMVSNLEKSICLSTAGIPFPYLPEHGILPCYYVPSHVDRDELLEPAGFIQEFYRLILQIQTRSLAEIGRFSHLVTGDSFSLVLRDSTTGNRLRLPSEHLRKRTISLQTVDDWLSSRPSGTVPIEIDARFPGIVVLRAIKGAVHHG
jgi:cell division septal protein FtsQ